MVNPVKVTEKNGGLTSSILRTTARAFLFALLAGLAVLFYFLVLA